MNVFITLADIIVQLFYNGQEFQQEFASEGKNLIAFPGQLFIKNIEYGKVTSKAIIERAEKGISLLKDPGIVDQRLQVVVVQLRKQGVNKFSSFLTIANDQLHIIGCNDHAGIAADVAGEFCIERVIYREFLFTGFT